MLHKMNVCCTKAAVQAQATRSRFILDHGVMARGKK